MAIRNIVKDTDNYDTLHKKCRPVTEFNQKLWDLLDDMAETMYQAEGGDWQASGWHAAPRFCNRCGRRYLGIYQS